MAQLDSTTSKAQLLDGLRDEQARWEALLHEIGADHMDQPGVTGEWTIKDIVAHLTFYRIRTVGRFQAALRREALPPAPWPSQLGTEEELEASDDEHAWDAVNAWIYAANHERPVADVLRESREVFARLVETLAAFPAEELANPARFPWLPPDVFPLTGAAFFGHFHDEHEPDIRAWLEKVRREER